MRYSQFPTLVTLAALTLGALLAQNNTGRISGTVMDPTGAAVPGAKIAVKNLATDLKWSATTDGHGFYVVTNLPVGTYEVEVSADGFRRQVSSGNELSDAGRLTAGFRLEIGSASERIVVSEVLGEAVNVASGEIGRVIDSEQVQDLALNGRNYLQLINMVPGVALLDEDQMDTTTTLTVQNQSVNGTRTNSNHLMVDGGMNLDSGGNGSQVNNVGVDFIREVKVQTSAMSAEYGRNSGASINVVTKGGGDRFHGGMLWTVRNDAVDASNYFATDKAQLRFNDYGWHLGGPVPFKGLKNRLFFFAGEEWKGIRKATTPTRRTLPTRAEMAGDFSGRSSTIYYPGTKTPIPNKNLKSLMTADSRAIMAVYSAMADQAASYSDTPSSNNAIYQMPNPFDWREDILRIDYRANDRHGLYFRWLHDSYDLVDPFGYGNSSQLPTTPTRRKRPGSGPQLGHTWTVSPRVVNEAKINAAWNGQRTPLQGTAWMRSTYGFQFPLVLGANGRYPNGMPDVTVSSFASFNGPARTYLMSPTTDTAVSEALTWIRSRHTLKTGFILIRNRKDQNSRTTYLGTVAFTTSANTNTSNMALADAALGNYATYNEAGRDTVGFFRFWQPDAFLQDDIRVARSLTLNIGLRYSRYLPTYTVANNMVNFDPSLYSPAQAVTVTSAGTVVANSGNPYNGLIRAGSGVPSNQVGRVPGASDTDAMGKVPAGAPRGFFQPSNLWMPRFGFAWDVFGTGKTSLRGGFGSFHDRIRGDTVFSLTAVPPFSNGVSYESGSISNPGGGTAAGNAVMSTIVSINAGLKVPVVYNYNFGIQRALPAGLFLDVAYVGNFSRHLLREPDINFPSFSVLAANYALPSAQRAATNTLRPYKGYSTIRMYLSDANSNYNSLQTYLTKRKGDFLFTVSHTWSHVLTDSSSDTQNTDSGLEYNNRHFNRGPATFDRRHVFIVTYTYRIPFLAKRQGAAGLFGGWELSGVTRSQAGPHLTAVGSATGVSRRADYAGGKVSLPGGERTPDRWINTAAFRTASSSALGNAGVGTIVGPGLYVWDASLRKSFRLREGWKLRFQADAFNLMNHVNFRSLNVTTSSADFGSVAEAGPARCLQGGLRLTF